MNNCSTILCACASLLCTSPAWAAADAPSSVQIYGLIDEGVQYVDHAAVGNQTRSVVETGAGMLTSLLGFRGNEDLGDGLHAVWELESGFAPNNGTLQQARMFGRQAYVGLDGHFGRLTIGRQYTMRAFATGPINMFGAGAQGITTFDSSVANPRADNAISYRISLTHELDVGINYSLGRDAVATVPVTAVATDCGGEAVTWKQCKEASALIRYTASNWGLDSAYERNNGGTATTFGGLTSPALSDSRLVVGGYRQIGDWKLALGLMKRNNMGIATPKSNLTWFMTTWQAAPNLAIDGMLAQLKYAQSPNQAAAVALRAAYSLSKQTVLYVTAEHIDNQGNLAIAASTLSPAYNPLPGGSQLAVIAGIKLTF